MCAIIGVYCQENNLTIVSLVERLFIESQIRGKHATGLSVYHYGEILTIIEPVESKMFIKNIDLNHGGHLKLIGHCRYSTSDIQFNQPIYSNELSIVHNGVITQDYPEKWFDIYGYQCEGKNDSELILRAHENNDHPLVKFEKSSMAIIGLSNKGEMFFYRNGQRPLWYYWFKQTLFISSTEDILKRTFKQVLNIDILPTICTSNTHYIVEKNRLLEQAILPTKDLQLKLHCSEYYDSIH